MLCYAIEDRFISHALRFPGEGLGRRRNKTVNGNAFGCDLCSGLIVKFLIDVSFFFSFFFFFFFLSPLY